VSANSAFFQPCHGENKSFLNVDEKDGMLIGVYKMYIWKHFLFKY